MNAKISEIFESIQGEGIYLGERQVFVRFFGCNLRCSFCDTPLAGYQEYDARALRSEILKYHDYHSLSLTGGEPLLQQEFLDEFLQGETAGIGTRIYLETNGTLPLELARVINRVDIVAMDFKLPSSCACGSFWPQHREFLKIAVTKDVFVKMVITSQTVLEDIVAAGEIIAEIKPQTPVVLQSNGNEEWSHLIRKMTLFKNRLLERGLSRVEILPQAHKLVGIR